jgi:hypothetical protein
MGATSALLPITAPSAPIGVKRGSMISRYSGLSPPWAISACKGAA